MDLIQRINRDGHSLLIASGIPTIQLACDDMLEEIKGRGMTLGAQHMMGLSAISWLEAVAGCIVFSTLAISCYERVVQLRVFGRDEAQASQYVADFFDERGLQLVPSSTSSSEVLEADHNMMLQLYTLLMPSSN